MNTLSDYWTLWRTLSFVGLFVSGMVAAHVYVVVSLSDRLDGFGILVLLPILFAVVAWIGSLVTSLKSNEIILTLLSVLIPAFMLENALFPPEEPFFLEVGLIIFLVQGIVGILTGTWLGHLVRRFFLNEI